MELPQDPNIWCTIPGFVGYEINYLGKIRSMKFPNKYPYGYMKKIKDNWSVDLQDQNNNKVTVSVAHIFELIKNSNSSDIVLRHTNERFVSARNKIFDDPYKNRPRYDKNDMVSLDMTSGNIIEDDTENLIRPVFYNT